MNAPSIVKRFDVIEYTQTGLFSSFIFFMMHQFRLKCAKEALCNRIVPAITFAAHAAFAAVCFELLCECFTGILTASV